MMASQGHKSVHITPLSRWPLSEIDSSYYAQLVAQNPNRISTSTTMVHLTGSTLTIVLILIFNISITHCAVPPSRPFSRPPPTVHEPAIAHGAVQYQNQALSAIKPSSNQKFAQRAIEVMDYAYQAADQLLQHLDDEDCLSDPTQSKCPKSPLPISNDIIKASGFDDTKY